ncbi:hypothetical protein JYP52_01140 [Nitratireductor aquibiodomus]|nr:hypothetical protein [Nitratireductor aquibiodomus]MBN7759726.1 hypothetical protein [Nitratireductor aquibiodomus]
MSKEFLRRALRYTRLFHPAGKRMTQIVNSHVGHTSPFADFAEAFSKIILRLSFLLSFEHIPIAVCFGCVRQCVKHSLVHGDVTRCSVFGAIPRQADHPPLHIELIPGKLHDLLVSHAGVGSKDQEQPM